jgi:1-phosphatidylinositol phosphodiesterase
LGEGFLAFPGDITDNYHAPVLVCVNRHGIWNGNENFGQTTRDTPVVAALEGVLYCVWVAADGTNALRTVARELNGFLVSSWMSDLPDSTLIQNLCIPGTHDSCTYGAPEMVETQGIPWQNQTREGIRFYDIRLGITPGVDDILVVHGAYILDWATGGILFEDMMTRLYETIQGTSECLVVLLRKDLGGDDLANRLKPFLLAHPDWWDQSSDERLPVNLGAVRGKMILLDGIGLGLEFGIDVRAWPRNSAYFNIPISGSIVKLRVQDNFAPDVQSGVYTPPQQVIDAKWGAVQGALAWRAELPTTWGLNFTSASLVRR